MHQPNKFLTIKLPWWGIAPLLLMVVEFLELLSSDFQISGNTIDDADTLMRLAYLRQAVADGHLTGGFFARNGAPGGMFLHWTLPFNLLVLGVGKLFWFLPFDGQLQQAGFWTGPVLRLVIAVAGYWAALQARLSRPAAVFASCLMLFSPYMLNYADQGSANHHPMLYLDTILAVGFAAAVTIRPMTAWPALGLGMLAGFCVWCSFELVIVAGGVLAWMFLLWVCEGPARLRQMLLASAAFAGITDVALCLDPPNGDIRTIVYDHISLPLQTLASLPLAVALCLGFLRSGSVMRRFVWCAVLGAGFGGLYLLAWPGVIAGVEGAMDPYVKTEWLSEIGEVRPIHAWRKIALYLGPAMLAIPLTLLATRRWGARIGLALLLAATCAMGQAHYRFTDYAVIAGAFTLAAAADAMARKGRTGRVVAISFAILLAGSFYAVEVLNSVFTIDVEHPAEANNSSVTNNGDQDADDNGASCDPYDVADALNDNEYLKAKPDAIVMADINMAPKILYWTAHIRTVAGNYHRDNAGIKDNYLFFRDMDDATAKAIAKARGIDFVLICSKGDDADYSFSTSAAAEAATHSPHQPPVPENTLYTRLVHHNPPAWLKPRDWPGEDESDSGLLLYQVELGEGQPNK